ncbi:hypothetical protein [Streptomyces sp. NPDC020607]|uniref:hypothetical protein n=1 Tax=Streptomyces sp. NPDC020607 TaxID=3365082 RepID=UPI0037A26B71
MNSEEEAGWAAGTALSRGRVDGKSGKQTFRNKSELAEWLLSEGWSGSGPADHLWEWYLSGFREVSDVIKKRSSLDEQERAIDQYLSDRNEPESGLDQ